MRIVVLGDVLLDVDLNGTADRLSPDAPVPVVEVTERIARAGGAGLVATLLARDGVEVELVTVLSDDAGSVELRAALEGVRLTAGPSGAPTPVKTRLRAQGTAIARIDDGCATPPPPAVTDAMLASVRSADAIIVADYGRGLAANPRLRRALDQRREHVPLVWDPHPRGALPVASTTVATPNLSEAVRASGESGTGIPTASRAAAALREAWGCASVVVTLGDGGALLDSGREGTLPFVVAARAVDAPDPCGAGDRLAASLARELAGGRSVDDGLVVAVTEAAAYLAAGGIATLARPANTPPLDGDASDALRVVRRVKDAGGTVVATGGCFDLVHAGHARTLSAARALGDCLVVCLNSDDSVRRLKGAPRPLMEVDDRIDLLLALECVDAVIVFDEDTPLAALARIEPDIWVKGGDYVAEELPETALMATWGGSTVTVPYYPGRSTTQLASALSRVG